MYENWLANATAIVATVTAAASCVLVHYEGLLRVSRGLVRLRPRHERVKVLYSILCILLLHVVEIWIFGLTLWALLKWPALGRISGQGADHLLDAVYFSAATFSTVGYGDITPVGPIRLLAGSEALVGFVLITWSASFTYIEMKQYWSRDQPRRHANVRQ